MEAFARSSTTLFAKANTNKRPSPVKALLSQSSICFVRFWNSNANVHHHTSLLRHKAFRSVASSETRVLRNPDSAGIGIEPAAPSKTVHVQFQLHKKCRFGDNFLLVGNEPIIGQWNPSSAIPLNWSDGNIWTVDLDIPIDRAIQFKFILKKSTGDLLWQPGPDRILHTWDTNSTITIAEDWKNAKLQKLTEKKIVSQNETLLTNQAVTFSDKFASANSIPTYSNKNEFAFKERAFGSEMGLLQESQAVCIADDGVCIMTRPTSLGGMDEDEYYDDEYYDDDCEYEDRYEDEDIMFTYEGGRVLVPGLVQGVTGKTIDISADGSIVIDARGEHNS
ncbi:phosphoglucan, water dikinase, chloroplastic-like [Rosa sericea]